MGGKIRILYYEMDEGKAVLSRIYFAPQDLRSRYNINGAKRARRNTHRGGTRWFTGDANSETVGRWDAKSLT